MIDVIHKMWVGQTFVIFMWSLMCFVLGGVCTAGLYYVRVKYVIKKSEKKIDELTS